MTHNKSTREKTVQFPYEGEYIAINTAEEHERVK